MQIPSLIWLVPVVSFAVAVPAAWLARFLALRWGIVDHPDETVKTHQKVTAYMGGLGILTGFLVLWVTAYVIFPGFLQRLQITDVVIFALSALLICTVGLLDDILDIKPVQKIAGQTFSALLAALIVIPVLQGHWPALPAILAALLSFAILCFFVLGATNSINLLDGLDGLCAGVAVIISAGFAVLALLTHSAYAPVILVLSLALAGAAAGFLVFNYPPASIFMGDAGSLLIGFVLAFQMVLLCITDGAAFLASLLIFGLPLLDTSVAILRRLINRKPLFVSDRGHIYDQLVDHGMTKKQSVWTCYLLTALFAAIGLAGYKLGLKFALPLYFIILTLTFLLLAGHGFLKKC